MKKWIVVLIIIGMLGWAVYDFTQSPSSAFETKETLEEQTEVSNDQSFGLEVGNKAPDFELMTLSGDEVRLSNLEGKRVMINFWATWCPPCRAEMPDMERFYQDKDIEVLAVNLTDSETDVESVQEFIDEYRFTFPILLDKEDDVSDMYRIQPIPTTYMVDSKGIIRYKAFGPMNYDLMVQEFEKMD